MNRSTVHAPGREKTDRRSRVAAIASLAAPLILGLILVGPFASRGKAQPKAAVAGSAMPATAPKGGIIYPVMREGAVWTDYGWEAYRLVCAACHAYDGQGLTPAWIETWQPRDRNCWQPKCHSASHPPDGFKLPGNIPRIMGEDSLASFPTAKDLWEYLEAEMPWQDPGYMTDEEYRNMTGFLLKVNDILVPKEPFDPEEAARLRLRK